MFLNEHIVRWEELSPIQRHQVNWLRPDAVVEMVQFWKIAENQRLVNKFWKKSSWFTDMSPVSPPSLKTTLPKMWSQWINCGHHFGRCWSNEMMRSLTEMRCYLHRMFHGEASPSCAADKSFIETPSFWRRHDCLCKWNWNEWPCDFITFLF